MVQSISPPWGGTWPLAHVWPLLPDTILLFLGSLSPPFSNCLNLPFGTQGRSRTLKAFFLQTRNKGHKKAFVPMRTPQAPAQFQFQRSLIIPLRNPISHEQSFSILTLCLFTCWKMSLLGILYQPKSACMYKYMYVCMHHVSVCMCVYGKRETEWQIPFLLGGSQPLLQGLNSLVEVYAYYGG